ncbi:50S ribosomal protein L35 [Candidatus Dependentiae bacterium]|nr:MAG: 50S ribosomal protein L35 [Candidatus Dependentiae bacterium]
MPKMKTHSASKKRFAKTKNGKIKRAKAYRRHHAWAKGSEDIRNLRGIAYVSKADSAKFKVLLPY